MFQFQNILPKYSVEEYLWDVVPVSGLHPCPQGLTGAKGVQGQGIDHRSKS